MNNNQNQKPYDLEERTRLFAKDIISFSGALPRTIANIEIVKQMVMAAGSVGANYIEANESLSKKDFGVRIKICRKEAKEAKYWLSLLEVRNGDMEDRRKRLAGEATELLRIFSSMVAKFK